MVDVKIIDLVLASLPDQIPSRPMLIRDPKTKFVMQVPYDIYVRTFKWCLNYNENFLNILFDGRPYYRMELKQLHDGTPTNIVVRNIHAIACFEYSFDDTDVSLPKTLIRFFRKLIQEHQEQPYLIMEVSNVDHALIAMLQEDPVKNTLNFGLYDPHGQSETLATIARFFRKLTRHKYHQDILIQPMAFSTGLQSWIGQYDAGSCLFICAFWMSLVFKCWSNRNSPKQLISLEKIEQHIISKYRPMQIYHKIIAFAIQCISQLDEMAQSVGWCIKKRLKEEVTKDKIWAHKVGTVYKKEPTGLQQSNSHSYERSLSLENKRLDRQYSFEIEQFYLRPFDPDNDSVLDENVWLTLLWPPISQASHILIYTRIHMDQHLNSDDVRKGGLEVRFRPETFAPCMFLPREEQLQLVDCNASCLIETQSQYDFDFPPLNCMPLALSCELVRNWSQADLIEVNVKWVRYLLTNYPITISNIIEHTDVIRIDISCETNSNETTNDLNWQIILDDVKRHKKAWLGIFTDLVSGQLYVLVSVEAYPMRKQLNQEISDILNENVNQSQDFKAWYDIEVRSDDPNIVWQQIQDSFLYQGRIPRLPEPREKTMEIMKRLLLQLLQDAKSFHQMPDFAWPTYSPRIFALMHGWI